MKLSRRRAMRVCARQSDVSFIKIPETCVCNSDLFSASPFSSARLKGNFGPFLPFLFSFFFFLFSLSERSKRESENFYAGEVRLLKFWLPESFRSSVVYLDFLKKKIWKSSFFFYLFLYASCKRQFISIDWFRISAKEVHPYSLLYGSGRPSANATNCCKQLSST